MAPARIGLPPLLPGNVVINDTFDRDQAPEHRAQHSSQHAEIVRFDFLPHKNIWNPNDADRPVELEQVESALST